MTAEMPFEAPFEDKVRVAFLETAKRADSAGRDEWGSRILLAEELWSEAAPNLGLDDYSMALFALDATIIAQAAGPSSVMLTQWDHVASRFGEPPGRLPEDGEVVGAYLREVSPLRLARSLALVMLDQNNPDRVDAEARTQLDEAAAALMVSDEAADPVVPTTVDRLLLVVYTLLGMLEETPEQVQNTRSRVEYTRDVLSSMRNITDDTTGTTTRFRWPTVKQGVEALHDVAGIVQDMEAMFRGRLSPRRRR